MDGFWRLGSCEGMSLEKRSLLRTDDGWQGRQGKPSCAARAREVDIRDTYGPLRFQVMS